jgi:hypothetical protein
MFFIGRTDGQTHGQLKTIVRNLTKYLKKKSFLSDGRTDTRTTQNYSSEPHKIFKKNVFYRTDGQTDVQLKTIVRKLTK